MEDMKDVKAGVLKQEKEAFCRNNTYSSLFTKQISREMLWWKMDYCQAIHFNPQNQRSEGK